MCKRKNEALKRLNVIEGFKDHSLNDLLLMAMSNVLKLVHEVMAVFYMSVIPMDIQPYMGIYSNLMELLPIM